MWVSVPQATSKTPAATSWRESQSSPSCRPIPLRASQPWMCQLRPQHSLCKLRSSVISSTDTAPGTSYRERHQIVLVKGSSHSEHIHILEKLVTCHVSVSELKHLPNTVALYFTVSFLHMLHIVIVIITRKYA